MDRRAVILGGFAACAAARSRAQPATRLPLVVLINPGTEATSRGVSEAFLRGMRDAGQAEGRTVEIRARYADGDTSRLPTLIRESLHEAPAVIVVAGLLAAKAAREATSTVAVVVATASDLVDAGLAKSHARPGGNVTGVSDLTDESAAKRLELLKTALPGASRVALLVNTEFPATPKVEARVAASAKSLGVVIERVPMRDRASMLMAVDTLARSRPDALLVAGDSIATVFRADLIERASALRVPVVHYWPGSAEQGALISLQVDIGDNYRRAAAYVDKILKGAKPAELPIQRPTRYELVVNLRVANGLGLAMPQSLLLSADKVIR